LLASEGRAIDNRGILHERCCNPSHSEPGRVDAVVEAAHAGHAVPFGHNMIRTPPEIDAPDSTWNRLAARTLQGDPFCCRSEWPLSIQQAFFPKRPLHLRESGSGFLALAERRYRGLGPTLEPLDSLWLFGSPLIGPGAPDLLEAFLAERASQGLSANLVLSGVLPDQPLRERILRSFHARYEIYRARTVVVCSASLEGGLEGFLARRSALFRKRLRQAARRAGERGLRFERVSARSPSQSDATFRRMLAVERTSWKGLEDNGITDPQSTRFYRALSRRLTVAAAGRVVFACVDGRDVGFIFGGVADGVYRGQQFSYADDWHEASIGNLLQQEQIRWLEEDGILRYDMGPMMDYKRHWTEREITMHVLLLRPKSRR
jgi:CelD/BcsL family acetyltransferase involved in cellulose biosynthesis